MNQPAAQLPTPEISLADPAKPAVIMADGSRVLSYGDLERRSRQLSRLLAGLGVGTGDHVAVMLANRPEYFEIGWGAQRRGTYWTPVNWHLTVDEAAYMVGRERVRRAWPPNSSGTVAAVSRRSSARARSSSSPSCPGCRPESCCAGNFAPSARCRCSSPQLAAVWGVMPACTDHDASLMVFGQLPHDVQIGPHAHQLGYDVCREAAMASCQDWR